MDELAERFEEHRTHLRAVGYRMLGSVHEADDAVQDAWLRLARLEPPQLAEIDTLGGWLTTTVSRLCLDQLRSRSRRLAEPPGDRDLGDEVVPSPEADAVLADEVGAALQVVLSTLSPAERLAFVLHDLFAVPFDEIGSVMGRSATAVRQLASRGRRRVQGADTEVEADRRVQREVVEAFIAASKGGDLDRLLTLLDPDAVVRADGAALAMGSPGVMAGREEVAAFWNGRAQAARMVLIDGWLGAVWQHQGEVKVAFVFTVVDGKVLEVELLGDPEVLGRFEVESVPQR